MSALEVMRLGLARWDDSAISRASRLTDGPRGALETRLGALWIAWLRGETWNEDDASHLELEAGRLRASDLVIDAATTRAIALVEQDRIEEAIAVARRASRMASTEGLRGPRALAGLVLARVRASAGHTEHATRILESLGGWLPPAWSGWLACERALASGIEIARGAILLLEPSDLASRAAIALGAVLERALDGDRARFADASTALLRETDRVGPIARRARATIALLDPTLDPDTLDVGIADFVRGEGARLPLGLGGLGVSGAGDDATAWIVRGPGSAGRRVARAGLALVSAGSIAATQRRTGREDVGLAVLALAGDEGVTSALLHRRVYRTAYEPELHDAALRVLAHRIGARLGDVGRVHVGAGRLALRLTQTILVPDPRCALSIEDRVLHALARRGRCTARDVATALDVPLRSVQGAIRELVEDGACREEPQGRRVEYVVEDTTYSDPTDV